MTSARGERWREALYTAGYFQVPAVMPGPLLTRLRELTATTLAAMSPEDQERQRSTGSMISVWDHPLLGELIALPEALAVLAEAGFPDPKISGGYIISKPPHSPRLFWHYDYTGWNDPDAFQLPPQQIFLMWYLTDTRPENGCLRVIPGTHVNDHPLIPQLREAHTDELRRGRHEERVEFSDQPDEVDVGVRAGDLVIGDSRLLHAAHANRTDERRTVITLWYHPDLDAVPERTRAMLAALRRPPTVRWPADAWARVEPLLIRDDGTATPYERSRHRPWPRPR